jgi:hypothetical protein
MSALGVDTRSDIYSLGVLLYELLTGSTPLDHKRVREAAYGEILRMIKEEEPPKPSTRLSDSGEALASISANRHTEPAKLTKLVKGELDWIVMKCLEKDRNRRYETANGFAADVQRYLADEPVLACPPSAGYRLRKFARKNRRGVAVALLIFALLVGGVVGTSLGLLRAIDARDVAVQEKKRADQQAAIALAVNSFLCDDLLAKASPFEQHYRDIKLRTVLDLAAERIAGRFDQQPIVEASIHFTIGRTYLNLSEYSGAKPHLEQALELHRRELGPEHVDTLICQSELAMLCFFQSKNDKGLTWSRPTRVAPITPTSVTDPETGQAVRSSGSTIDVAVDPVRGNLYAVWQDGSFTSGQYSRIAFSMSSDGGFTWSMPVAINQTPGDIPAGNRQAFVPSVDVAADGTVAVTYYDFRLNDANPGLPTDYWVIHGHPNTDLSNPVNWGKELRLTNTSFDTERAPFAGGFMIGDYQGLASVGNDLVAFFFQAHGADSGSIFFRRIIEGAPLQVAFVGRNHGSATLTSQQVDSLLPEAMLRWQVAGANTSVLHGIDIRIADLGGATLGLASGNTLWLDDNAAGWGWFVDPTPADDSEFTTPGNQGEQNRIDLLTVLEHEIGHLLGKEHEEAM